MAERRRLGGRTTVLSIDPRIRRIGFACVEVPLLVDWGVRNVRDGKPATRVRRSLIPLLVEFLDHFSPDVVLVPDIDADIRRSAHVVNAIRAVSREATRRGVSVHAISHRDVKAAFHEDGGQMVQGWHDVNRKIVNRFPELTTSMPKARRQWDEERYFTPLFQAVGMYWAWRTRTQ